jgi:hypothetical protein
MLLLATAISAGSALAQAPQDATAAADDAGAQAADATGSISAEEDIDIAMPGITVTGVRERNIQKATTERSFGLKMNPNQKISRPYCAEPQWDASESRTTSRPRWLIWRSMPPISPARSWR